MACKIMMSPVSPRTLLSGDDLWNLEQLFILGQEKNLTDPCLEQENAALPANESINSTLVEVVCAPIGFIFACDDCHSP